jgi:hypothetical protein
MEESCDEEPCCIIHLTPMFLSLREVPEEKVRESVKYTPIFLLLWACTRKNPYQKIFDSILYIHKNFGNNEKTMARARRFYRYLRHDPFGIQFKKVVETLKNLLGEKKMDLQEIFEQDRVMSSFEDGIEEGRKDEREKFVMRLQKHALSQLKSKFSRIPKALANQIKAIKDYDMLATIVGLFGGVESLEDAERHVNTVLATA